MASTARPPGEWPTSRIPRPGSVAEERGRRPGSVADIEDSEARQRGRGGRRPDSVADIEDSEARQRGRGEKRPDSMANFKARELRGRLRGPRVAWPTSRPASCVADVRPVQAVAERKHERKGAGAEVEEARAGRALPAPTTRHPRRRNLLRCGAYLYRTANTNLN